MRILLHTLNYAPEPTGIGLYSGGLAQSLVELGHEVHVLCAVPHYPQWQLFDGHRQRWTTTREAGVDVIRCPIYIPAGGGGAKRIVHYISFFLASLWPIVRLSRRFRPELVFAVAPSLIASPASLLAARVSGAASQLHVQDFEVEAAFATDHMSGGGPTAKLARWFEQKMLRAFDRVSTISPEMARKLGEKGVEAHRICELRNWAEIEHIRPQPGSTYRDRWQIGSRHVALYSGSIAQKQGIESIVDAARAAAHRKDLVFVICGSGPRRQALADYAKGLDNVQIHDLQPMEELGELLNLATVHLLPQRKDAADLVLPSKLANMLASGKPVVASVEPGTGVAREIRDCGLACPPEDGQAMANAICSLLDDEDLRTRLGAEARRRAQERWSRTAILARFDAELRSAVSTRTGESTSHA